MENDRDRVRVVISMESGEAWQLITSRSQAKTFINEWKEVAENYVTITGTMNSCDANEIEYTFKRERIECVEILEVKV